MWDWEEDGYSETIDGVLYDTTLSEYVGEKEYKPESQGEWQIDRLYRTDAGVYFMWGTGGPSSTYRVKTADGALHAGEAIWVLGDDEAKVLRTVGPMLNVASVMGKPDPSFVPFAQRNRE